MSDVFMFEAKIVPSLFDSDDWRGPYAAFVDAWRTSASPETYGDLDGVPLVKISIPGDRRLVIISGVHGEEQVGPVTLLKHVREIVGYATERGVGLTIYPMFSPTGWGRGKRNTEDDERTNNMIDFKVDGSWKDDVYSGEEPDGIKISEIASDEARALMADIERDGCPDGMLDIHQDSDMDKKGLQPVTYAYVFDEGPYIQISKAAGEILPLASGTDVELYDGDSNTDEVSENGMIVCHPDSTTQGLFYAIGCHNSVTIETSLGSDPADSDAVNMVWIRGMIDIIAH